MYKAGWVPVGEDQVPHVELTREIARRFNYVFGREPDFEAKAEAAVKKLGKKNGKLYTDLRKRYQQQGDAEALKTAAAIVTGNQNLTLGDRDRLLGHLEGGGRPILTEPQPLLTESPRMPGLDGQKMSKSYGNTIALREEPDAVAKKVKTMPTDPARVKRSDPGDPAKCPVWPLHQIYSDDERKKWVQKGCTTAGIGCLECKQPVIEAINKELAPMRARAQAYLDDPTLVKNIVADGCEKARRLAAETMREVRESMGLAYT
jgi:tryptophanyl-tRNA synthetase